MPGSTESLDTFRAETRAWLLANCPASMRTQAAEADDVWGGRRAVFTQPDAQLWLQRMVERGWTAPSWPRRFGGADLDQQHERVLEEELKSLGCRVALKSLGIWLLGPALLEFGTEEQKQRFLPGMARGETRWCQGYSEPAAGSDLAGLQTRAVRDGDHYVINGQKVWTSHADKADYCFCLVRTDSDAAKRDGISFVLFDMQTPGVTVRPITLISGASPFCEMFLDDVRVPIANRIGPENGGWTVAKAVLGHERALISKMRDARPEQDESLPDIAKRHIGIVNGRIADAVLRDRIAQAEIDFECNRAMLRRAQAAAEAGLAPGPETLTFKLNGTEVSQRIKALKLQMLGPQALGWEGPGFDSDALRLTREWLRSRGNSIEGGSSEIQLNIIAKQALGLPD